MEKKLGELEVHQENGSVPKVVFGGRKLWEKVCKGRATQEEWRASYMALFLGKPIALEDLDFSKDRLDTNKKFNRMVSNFPFAKMVEAQAKPNPRGQS